MTAAPSLRRNAAWALVGNVGYAACQWGMLVVMARIGTAMDVGRFALGLALTAPVVIFTNLGLRTLQATDALDESPFGVYLGLRLVGAGVALVVIAVLGLALGYHGTTLGLIAAVGLAKSFEAVNDVFLGLFQKREELRRICISLMTKGIASVAVLAAVMWATDRLVVATFAMALAWGALLLVQDVRVARHLVSIRPSFDREKLVALAKLALPAGCMASLVSLTVNVPRFAIQRQLGSIALGHFAALAYILVAATQPVLALGVTVSPRLARLFHADRAGFRRLTRLTVLAAAGLGVAGVAAAAGFGRPFLALAYGPDYAEHGGLLVWLSAAAGVSFMSAALGSAVTAARRIAEQSLTALVATVICVLASAVLIPRYGLVGAAWAVLATEVSRLLCLRVIYTRACEGGAKMAASIGVAVPAPAGAAGKGGR